MKIFIIENMLTFKTSGSSRLLSMAATAAFGIMALTSSAAAEEFIIKTETHTQTFGKTATNFTDILTFSKFDLSLGTLQSIQFEIEGSIFELFDVTNNGAASANVRLLSDVTLTLETPFGTIFTLTQAASSMNSLQSYTAGENRVVEETLSANASSTYNSSGVRTGGTTGATSIDISDFTTLEGGTFTLKIIAEGESGITTSGNFSAEKQTQAAGSAKVTYTYATPVPEPGTWAALAMGAGVLAFSARFRRRSA